MNCIHMSRIAKDDLAEIKQYITEKLENPIAAHSVVKRITHTIRELEQQSLIGTPLSSLQRISSDYRYLVCGNYMIFYRTYESDVYIDRILYGRRDYMKVLFGEPLDSPTGFLLDN